MPDVVLSQHHWQGAVEVEAPWPVRVQGREVLRCWAVSGSNVATVESVLCALWLASGSEAVPGARLYAMQDSRPLETSCRLEELDQLMRVRVLGRICGGVGASSSVVVAAGSTSGLPVEEWPQGTTREGAEMEGER